VINLTREQRHTERQVLLRILDAIAARMQEDLAQEWAQFARDVSAHFRGAAFDAVLAKHRKAMQGILAKWYRITARTGTGRLRDALRKRKSFSPGMERKATEAAYNVMLEDWVKKNSLWKAKSLEATDKARIKRWFGNAVTDDMPGEAVIGKRIYEDATDITKSRARTIARTETHFAVQATSAETMRMEAEAVGLEKETKKVWTAGIDMRVRESHAEADGQTVGLDESFTVGGVLLKFPGDESGPPEEVINCRCILTYEVEDADWDAAEAAHRARLDQGPTAEQVARYQEEPDAIQTFTRGEGWAG